MGKSVLVVCLSPTFQKTMVFDRVRENEVNRSRETFTIASGKGVNVARVLVQLGDRATVLTHLGGNRTDEFLSYCSAEKIEIASFPSRAVIRTCTTVVDRAEGTSTELVEEAPAVEEGAEEKAWDAYASLVPSFDAVVITGKKAPGYSARLYPRMTERAAALGKIVILDLRGEDLVNSLPFHPTVIKPNLPELMATYQPSSVPQENEDAAGLLPSVRLIAEKIEKDYGSSLVISRGKYPAWVFTGGSFREIPTVNAGKVVNTIGCGDALTAGITHGLLSGLSLGDATEKGMWCAAKNACSLRHGIL